MSFDPTTPNWKLVIQAIEALNGAASIPEIEAYFKANFPPIKRAANVRADATSITVNANSRVHYGAGKKVRRTDSANQYDRLYRRGDGRYELYLPEKHGVWEVAKNSQGNLYVQQVSESDANASTDEEPFEIESLVCDTEKNSASSRFAMESHLRDYLAQNLNRIQGLPTQLDLYRDDSDMPAVEYRTSVGYIDILAKGADGAFYVLELKLARGSDAVIGQILRYMGWVRTNLAKGSPVYGVVVASGVSEKLKYAASEVPGILLMEYELNFSLRMSEKI